MIAAKKIRYQAGLITDFKESCKNYVIIRSGYLSLMLKRRSNRDRSIPVALIMAIMLSEKAIMIRFLNWEEDLMFKTYNLLSLICQAFFHHLDCLNNPDLDRPGYKIDDLF